MFKAQFWKLLSKEAVATFVSAFGAFFVIDPDLSKATLAGAVVAGGRAVFGLLISKIGEKDTPHF